MSNDLFNIDFWSLTQVSPGVWLCFTSIDVSNDVLPRVIFHPLLCMQSSGFMLSFSEWLVYPGLWQMTPKPLGLWSHWMAYGDRTRPALMALKSLSFGSICVPGIWMDLVIELKVIRPAKSPRSPDWGWMKSRESGHRLKLEMMNHMAHLNQKKRMMRIESRQRTTTMPIKIMDQPERRYYLVFPLNPW